MSFSVNYIYDIVDKYSDKIKKITANTQKFIKTINTANDKIKILTTTTEEYRKKLNQTNTALAGFDKKHGIIGNQISKIDKKTNKALKNVNSNAFATTAVLAVVGHSIKTILTYGVKSAMKFELAMANLQKSAKDMTTLDQFNSMKDVINEIAGELGQMPCDIAAISASAAKMGISFKDLPKFTEIAAHTSMAFDMNAEDTGIILGKMKDKFGLNTNELKDLMDAVNFVADQSAVQSKDLIRVMERAAISSKSWNFSEIETVALSTAALQISATREEAGSGLRRAITTLAMNPGYADRMKENPMKTFTNLLKGLNIQIKSGDTRGATEYIQSIFGKGKYATFVSNLAGRFELVEKSMGLIADKALFADSMLKEVQRLLDTTAYKEKMLVTAWEQFNTAMGDALKPVYDWILVVFKPIINWMTEFVKTYPNFVRFVALLLLIVGIVTIIFGIFIAWNLMIALFGTAMVTAAVAASLIAMKFLAIAAIIVIIVVMIILWGKKIWDLIKIIYAFGSKIGSMFGIQALFKAYIKLLKFIANWLKNPMKSLSIWLGDLFKSIMIWIEKQFMRICGWIKKTKEFFGFGDDKDTTLDETAKNAIINTKQTTYMSGGIDINVTGPGHLSRASLKASDNANNNGFNMPSSNGQYVTID